MNKGTYVVILVPSTSYALRAENVLHMAGIESKLIPVPRSLSSDCGVCVRIKAKDTAAAEQALQRQKAVYERVATYT